MTTKLILMLIFLVTVISESTLVSFPLTLVFISVLSIVIGRRTAIWAFVVGIILDFFLLRPLGIDSLFFLLVVVIADRYKKKISTKNIAYPLIYIGLVSFVYNLIFLQRISILQQVYAVILGSVFIWVIGTFFPDLIDSKRKLSV